MPPFMSTHAQNTKNPAYASFHFITYTKQIQYATSQFILTSIHTRLLAFCTHRLMAVKSPWKQETKHLMGCDAASACPPELRRRSPDDLRRCDVDSLLS